MMFSLSSPSSSFFPDNSFTNISDSCSGDHITVVREGAYPIDELKKKMKVLFYKLRKK